MHLTDQYRSALAHDLKTSIGSAVGLLAYTLRRASRSGRSNDEHLLMLALDTCRYSARVINNVLDGSKGDMRPAVAAAVMATRHLSRAASADAHDDVWRAYGLCRGLEAATQKHYLARELREHGRVNPQDQTNVSVAQFFSDVRDVVTVMNLRLQGRQLSPTMHADVAVDKLRLFTSPSLLMHAVWNVLDNAIRYSYDSEPIEFSISVLSTRYVLFTVTSIGLPISNEDLVNVGKAGWRGHKAAASYYGNGLGLYVNGGILTAIGGQYEVQVDGSRTSVSIRVPTAGD